MVIVSEKSVRRMIEDVAPKVERLTGWDLKLDDLEVRIIGRNQYYEEAMLPTYKALGIDTEAKTEKGKKAVKTMKKIMPYMILGQYTPLNERMIVLPDNLRFGTNESGLTVTLGHELVHRGQFINNPKFARLYSHLARAVTGRNAFDDDLSEDERMKPFLQSYMTLVEGDASFVEGQLKQMFYQDAKNKTSWASNFLGATLLLAGVVNGDSSFKDKLRQYNRGKEIVKKVYEARGRKLVDVMYDLNELELRRIF
jgi:hypothetical protein